MKDFLIGILVFLIYLSPLATLILLIRKFTKVSDELFRKILHFLLLGAYIPLLFGFKVWWHSLIFVLSLGILLFPTLFLAGKIPGFSSFVNERKKGEFASSMVLAISIMAISITIGWGLIQNKYIVLAGIYCWGVGDAFAALIGKNFGKHKILWKFADTKKSVEGSVAMFVTSAIAVFTILLISGEANILLCILFSLIASLASTFVELCSKNGLDTIFCPLVSIAVISPILII